MPLLPGCARMEVFTQTCFYAFIFILYLIAALVTGHSMYKGFYLFYHFDINLFAVLFTCHCWHSMYRYMCLPFPPVGVVCLSFLLIVLMFFNYYPCYWVMLVEIFNLTQ